MFALFPNELNCSYEEFDREARAFANPELTHTHQINPVVRTINAPADKCLQQWVEFVWKRGAGLAEPKELRRALTEHGDGLIRTPGFGLFEAILDVDPKRRYVSYSVVRGLPVTSHHASVYFEQLDNGSTRIIYSLRYTPTWYGGWLGAYCEKMLFPLFLRNLRNHIDAMQSKL